MYIGRNSSGNFVNLLTVLAEELSKIKNNKWYCPSCQAPVILKQGKHVRPHFAHLRRERCHGYSEGETAEHLQGKSLLAKWCEQAGISYELEAYLPELNQRPDLLVAGKYVIEFQCSQIGLTTFLSRTESYLKYGYTVIWLAGGKLKVDKQLTVLQRGFLAYSQELGHHFFELDVTQEQLICRYHIEEHVLFSQFFMSQETITGSSQTLSRLLKPTLGPGRQESRVYHLDNLLAKMQHKIDGALLRRQPRVMAVQHILYSEGSNVRLLADEFLLPVTTSLIVQESLILWRFYFWKACQKYEGQTVDEVATYFKSVIKTKGWQVHTMPLIPYDEAIQRFIDETVALFSRYQRIKLVNERLYVLKVSSLKKEQVEWHEGLIKSPGSSYHISSLIGKDMLR